MNKVDADDKDRLLMMGGEDEETPLLDQEEGAGDDDADFVTTMFNSKNNVWTIILILVLVLSLAYNGMQYSAISAKKAKLQHKTGELAKIRGLLKAHPKYAKAFTTAKKAHTTAAAALAKS